MDGITFNFLAIIAATIASVVLGGAYVAVFGKLWAQLNGFSDKQVADMKQNGAAKGYIGITLANFAMALGLAYFISAIDISSLSGVLLLTFWAFVGFVGPLTIAPVLWENKPLKLWIFNNVINVICLLVMVLILTFWR